MDTREGRYLKKLEDKLELIETFLNGDTVDESTYDDFAYRDEILADVWVDFKQHEDQLRAKAEIVEHRKAFEFRYIKLRSKVKGYLRNNSPAVEHVPDVSANFDEFLRTQTRFLDEFSMVHRNKIDIKLPSINIPQFSGSYYEWPTFENLFTQIHNNARVSKIQKFQYLKGLMVPNSTADELIKNFAITDANYDEAWQKLQDRFNKPRHIITAYVRKFMEQPSTKNSISATGLRHICDTTDHVIRGLRSLGNNAETRDPFLIYLLQEKIDDETKHLWAREIQDNNYPTITEFIDFLSKRCDALESVQPITSKSSFVKSNSTHKSNTTNRISSFNSNTTTSCCPRCNQNHHLHDCTNFKSMGVSERQQFVAAKSLCFNCLRSGHRSNQCRGKFSCHKCNKRHHTLIHFAPSISSAAGNTIASGNALNANSGVIENPSSANSDSQSLSSSSCQPKPTISSASCIVNLPADAKVVLFDSHSFTPTNNVPVLKSPANMFNEIAPPHVDAEVIHQINSLVSSRDASFKCNTLLPTVCVSVLDSLQQLQCCRGLLDSGSHASFITESFAQRLSLQRFYAKKHISGLGSSTAGCSRGYVELRIYSKYQNKFITIQALILSTLTSLLPPTSFDVSSWDYIEALSLADPKFNCSGSIDILIGIEHAFDVFTGNIHHGPQDYPPARETLFGWVLSGNLPQAITSVSHLQHSHNIKINIEDNLDYQLRLFWELENIPDISILTEDEKHCEELFVAGVKRLSSGRFSVRLPFKPTIKPLGSSLNKTIARFNSMERQFKRNPDVKLEYSKFIHEYIALNHMVEIPAEEVEIADYKHFYLPHHAVVKEDSTSTKLRVVFDGSSKTSTGYSINDNLHVGVMLQPKLFSVLLKFRLFKIAMVADIEKMFRQVQVHDDCDYQRIVWRDDEDELLRHYRLLTVTYGLSCSPFLATRSLRELSNIIRSDEPRISKIIDDQFYVDDLMMGSDDLDDAKQLRIKITEILLSAGFPLRKWKSNNEEILSSIPNEQTEQNPLNIQDPQCSFKVLGMKWSPHADCFTFQVKSSSNQAPTKRSILSEMASIYDPLGFLAPSVVVIKILLQTLWLRNVDWDDSVPEDIGKNWHDLRSQFEMFNTVHIPRYIMQSSCQNIELHGFADASERAYAAAIYVRCVSEDSAISVHLVAAKTKVAPLKTVSIPRLELCAALLLVRLMKVVKQSLGLESASIICWSDSTTVLAWLSDHPTRWKTFVGNRTSEILESVDRHCWHHIGSTENAADCASRGLMPKELKNHDMWWHGPLFLRNADFHFPVQDSPVLEGDSYVSNEERVKPNCLLTTALTNQAPSDVVDTGLLQNLLNRCSTWFKLTRVLAFILRFIRHSSNHQSHATSTTIAPLSSEELRAAQTRLFKIVQEDHFGKELKQILRDGHVSHRSKIISLTPFIHTDGLLRVGGRLNHASIPYDMRHQIILPKQHPITKLIIQHYHNNYFHAGTSLLILLLRQRFWIVQCRNMVKNCVHHCVKCFRNRATTRTQIMGALPAARSLADVSPFTHTGIDYAGPFQLKDDKTRKAKIYKGYIAVFVCFSTKALHIEVVKDLTSESFIGALRKFVSRRGNPHTIYSDNGSTFVGANRELKRLFNFMISDVHNQAIVNELNKGFTKWQFIPPNSPHFGGLWEAGVKSVKQHLKRAVSNIIATHDEISTMLYQIEALLNSRPLCPMSDDPSDMTYLTPGHFLIGKPLTMLPDPDLQHLPENRLSKWQNLQKRVQGFWKIWRMEYLTSLQQRSKWRDPMPNIKVNDLVLIKDDNSAGKGYAASTGKWNAARVIKCYPGSDGNVRVVDIKTKDGVYQRPIHKLCLLPIRN